ncbi:PAS domain S-box protein [Microvirga arabica]|uniref:Blue-light-activated histidine kinase n=1 Tax=Microvirga arabica TaxID=1128671 RepID=A0ABV6YE02_9HYPH
MHGKPGQDTPVFLIGGGDMGRRMRTNDWSSSAMGSPDGWPQCLRTLVSIMLGSNQPMFVAWGPELRLLYNDSYGEILGLKHPQALGQPLLDVWSEVRADLVPLVDRTLAGESVHMKDISFILERKGYPEEAHFAFSYTPVRDEAGEIAGIFCPCIETTGQVLAERKLVAERERQQQLFEQAPGFITILSGPDHVFEFVNHAYSRLFGERDFLDRPVRDVFPDLQDQGFYELLDQVYASGERFIARRIPIRLQASPDRPATELHLDFIYEPICDEVGSVTGIFVEGHDVTAQVQAEHALQAGNERIRFQARLLDAVDQAVIATDLDGSVTFWNRFAEQLYGWTAEEALGRNVLELTSGSDPAKARQTMAKLAQGGGWSGEFTGRRRDGSTFPGHVTDAPVYDEQGQLIGIVGVSYDISDRKRAELALRDSEARLRIAQEAGGIGTYEWNLSTGELWVSEVMRRLWGLPLEGSVSLGAAVETVHPDDRHLVLSQTDKPLEEAVGYVEYRIIRPDTGEVRWMARRGEIIRDARGRALRVIGAFYDITERVQAERALRESETRLSTLMEHLPVGVGIFDPEGRVLVGNPVLRRFVSEIIPSVSDHEGRWRAYAADGSILDRSEYPGKRALRGETVLPGVEFLHRRDDGTEEWVSVGAVPLRDHTGQVTGAVTLIQDVTEAKMAEVALRASEAHFRHMADSAPALIWMTDRTGHVTFANKHFGHLFWRPVSDMLGTGWRQVVHPDDVDAFEAGFLDAFRARRPFRAEVRTLDNDGQVRWIRTEGVARLDDTGHFLGYTACGIDITDVKAAEEHQQLLINELNHRVKNTLATVQSIASQTLRNAPTAEAAREAFESRLLALSRTHDVLTRENWEGAFLREIVAQALEPYRSYGEERLHWSGPKLRLSPRMALALAMALQELATNAVKYGALSDTAGRLDIGWSVDRKAGEPYLHLKWQESGGPPVQAPARRGFGTRLIERSLAQELNGEVRILFEPTGVVCVVEAPLA